MGLSREKAAMGVCDDALVFMEKKKKELRGELIDTEMGAPTDGSGHSPSGKKRPRPK